MWNAPSQAIAFKELVNTQNTADCNSQTSRSLKPSRQSSADLHGCGRIGRGLQDLNHGHDFEYERFLAHTLISGIRNDEMDEK